MVHHGALSNVTTNDTSSKTISVSCGDIIRIDTISLASSAGHNNLIMADNRRCYISVGLSDITRPDTHICGTSIR
jgi:hypothetical protein